jgi:uncharacterized iron-regulated membrane protein
MTWAKAHRWLAVLLVVLLAVWSVTGLLFHLKPGWDRAYDMLSAERGGPLHPAQLVAPATVGDDITGLELIDTALGPLYRVTNAAGSFLVDASTGTRRSPLSEADARTLALDAVSRSKHQVAYGQVGSVTSREDAVVLVFSGGATVEVSRADARMSQRGHDTDRIDWLYRIHYLQWTGNKTIDRAFAMFGLALIWAVVIPGLVLFVRRLRRQP